MSEKIIVSVKAGLLRTIAHSIYSDPVVKIREAVSNSVDNKASNFIITVDKDNRAVSLFDDGHGITPSHFRKILKSIGSGTSRKDTETNSFFGLGLMSVLQMAEEALIITRPKSLNTINKYSFKSKEIFSESMMDNEMATIVKHISPEIEITLEDREQLSPLKHTEVQAHGLVDISSCSFTEILLLGVDSKVIDSIVTEEFKTNLRKKLPLKVADNDPFFGLFHENQPSLDVVQEMLNDKAICPTIKVVFHTLGENVTQLYKFYPPFSTDISFRECDFFYKYDPKNEYAWYYVISTQDLHGNLKKSKKRKGKITSDMVDYEDENPTEAGFWIRNKNFLVKASDYLKHQKTRKEIISQPLRNWIFGEIFHKDMTSMLVVTRDEFIWNNETFLLLRDELAKSVKEKDRLLREAWKKSKSIIDSLVTPLKKIHSGEDFASVHKSLMMCNIIQTEEDCEELLADLGNLLRVPEIEDESKRIDLLLDEDDNKELVLLDDTVENVKVVISGKVNNENGYIKTREGEKGGVALYISSDLFQPTKTTFLGKQFDLKFVAMASDLADISINIQSGSIYVNPFNHDISKFKLTFYEVLIAIRIAQSKCKNTSDMARMIIDLVGNKFYHMEETSKQCMENLNSSLSKRGQNA